MDSMLACPRMAAGSASQHWMQKEYDESSAWPGVFGLQKSMIGSALFADEASRACQTAGQQPSGMPGGLPAMHSVELCQRVLVPVTPWSLAVCAWCTKSSTFCLLLSSQSCTGASHQPQAWHALHHTIRTCSTLACFSVELW